MIRNIVEKHPEIDTGVGCVRIRDSQTVPLVALRKSFKQAFLG